VIACLVTFVGLCIYFVAYTLPIRNSTITKTSDQNSTDFPHIASNLPSLKKAEMKTTDSQTTFVKTGLPAFKKAMLPTSVIPFSPIAVDPDLTRVKLPTMVNLEITLQDTKNIPEISALEFQQTIRKKRGPPTHVKQIYPRTIHVDPYIKPSRKFDDRYNDPWKIHGSKNVNVASRKSDEWSNHHVDTMDHISI
jgi:hypothetical protein